MQQKQKLENMKAEETMKIEQRHLIYIYCIKETRERMKKKQYLETIALDIPELLHKFSNTLSTINFKQEKEVYITTCQSKTAEQQIQQLKPKSCQREKTECACKKMKCRWIDNFTRVIIKSGNSVIIS